jgi:RNA polymerase sigma-70 factor (ECF subfamily)
MKSVLPVVLSVTVKPLTGEDLPLAEELASLSDTSLMRRAQSEDAEAFSVLVQRYRATLLRVARSRVRRADWADELVQETLLAAYRSRRTFDPRFSFRTWLWTILLNQCKAHSARHARQPQVQLLADTTEANRPPIAHAEGPFFALLRKERAAILDELLARLPTAQADALRLRFFAELKFQEIADAMDCSLLTAKNRVRAGLLKLAQWAPSELAEHRPRPKQETTTCAEPNAESL